MPTRWSSRGVKCSPATPARRWPERQGRSSNTGRRSIQLQGTSSFGRRGWRLAPPGQVEQDSGQADQHASDKANHLQRAEEDLRQTVRPQPEEVGKRSGGGQDITGGDETQADVRPQGLAKPVADHAQRSVGRYPDHAKPCQPHAHLYETNYGTAVHANQVWIETDGEHEGAHQDQGHPQACPAHLGAGQRARGHAPPPRWSGKRGCRRRSPAPRTWWEGDLRRQPASGFWERCGAISL